MNSHKDLLKSLQELTSQTCLMKKHSSLSRILVILENTEYEDFKSLREKQICLNKLSAIIIESALVKEIKNIQSRDYEKKDFVGVSENAAVVLNCMKLLLPHVQQDSKFLATTLTLCATHSQDYLWSSQENVTSAEDLVKRICNAQNCSCVEELLAFPKINPSVFQVVLEQFKTNIESDLWKKNPSTIPILKWFLLKLKHPHLSPFFSRVLSPSLRMIDDYRNETRIHGVECIRHIIENVPKAELLMYGRADVIYDALFHLTFIKESDLIEVVYPCVLSFLRSTEKDLNRHDRLFKAGRYDAIYNNLLTNMAHEQRLVLRRAYSIQLSQFIDSLGITVCRHMKGTLLVLCEYLITYDSPGEETRLNILQALNCLLIVAWPRLAHHYEEILKHLFQILYDTVMNSREGTSEKVKAEMIIKIKECFINLKNANPETFMRTMTGVIDLQVALPVIDCLRGILDDSQ